LCVLALPRALASTPFPYTTLFRSYDRQHAYEYLHKHQDGPARRLSHWRDEQMARRALKIAGKPDLVLDLPCGAGRFWPLLAEHRSEEHTSELQSRENLVCRLLLEK